MLVNLKSLRKEINISQQRLGDAVNISQQSINQYENSDVEPDISALSRLADFFDTSVDYIVGRTDIRRRIEATREFDLNEREAALISRYRTLNEPEKSCVETVVGTLADR